MPVKTPTRMRGLTLRQPWAFAVPWAGKDIENRSYAPPEDVLGQTFGLHAGSARPTRQDLDEYEQITQGEVPCPRDPVYGAVVAVARVAGWLDTRALQGRHIVTAAPGWGIDPSLVLESPWYTAQGVGIVLRDVLPLERPVPASGRERWWWMDEALTDSVLEACGACAGCGGLARYLESDARWCRRCHHLRLEEAAAIARATP